MGSINGGGTAMVKGRRELILVVEGTKAIQPHWSRIKDHYIDKIVRSFIGGETIGWFGLVVFTSHNCSCLVRRSCWTTSDRIFFDWLEQIHFRDGDGVATAEGLAEALAMFSDSAAQGNQDFQNRGIYQQHCVLITSTTPSNFPTTIPKLPFRCVEQSNGPEISSEHKQFYDVVDVAKYFSQCFVSLSIISTTQYILFQKIFDAAKRDQKITKSDFENFKNPDQFLILLSSNCREVYAAFNPSSMHNLYRNKLLLIDKRSQHSRKKTLRMRKHSENRSVMWTSTINKSIPVSLVKLEPSTVPFDTRRPILDEARAHATSQDNKSLPGLATQNPTLGKDLVQDSKPLTNATFISGVGQPLSLPLTPYVLPSPLQNISYLKVWEGHLSGELLGHHVHIRFEGYRSAVASETLANDWPTTMQFVSKLGWKTLENFVYASAFVKQYTGMAEIVCFRKLDQPKLLCKFPLRTKWLIIRLPSQTLLLCLAKEDDCCGGLLFPDHMEYLLYETLVSHQERHEEHGVQHQELRLLKKSKND